MSGTVAEPADDRVRFTVASDPMMGLAWECEPVLRRLETHFAGRIEIRHAMSVLVRTSRTSSIRTTSRSAFRRRSAATCRASRRSI